MAAAVPPNQIPPNKVEFQHPDKVIPFLKVGDIIEFNRIKFSHYALYTGCLKVMNICAESRDTTCALIQEELLADVAKTSYIRIRNHDDIALQKFKVIPQPLDKILAHANQFANKKLNYNFLLENCEYYSTLWRFGKGFSTQAASYHATISTNVNQQDSLWSAMKSQFKKTDLADVWFHFTPMRFSVYYNLDCWCDHCLVQFRHVSIVEKKLEVGDIIEIDKRGLISHYCLHLGTDKATGDRKLMTIQCPEDMLSNSAIIKVETLRKAVGNWLIRRRNHDAIASTIFRRSALPPEEIIAHAKAFANSQVPYNVALKNCEYYATLWRFGIGFSTQGAHLTWAECRQQAHPSANGPVTFELIFKSLNFLHGNLSEVGWNLEQLHFDKYKHLKCSCTFCSASSSSMEVDLTGNHIPTVDLTLPTHELINLD